MRKETLEALRKEYPIGSRVELVRMDDAQAPPIGTKGTVKGVDDIGSIMVAWDTGSSLSVVYGVDAVKKLDTVTTICYKAVEVWDSRQEAQESFHEAICGSEGAERERYLNVYTKLIMGLEVCGDDADD